MTEELTTPTATELAPADIASAFGQIESKDLILPVVKLAQSLTKEVTEGTVKPGQFVNSLTGTVYGTGFEFIIAAYFKGRFYATKDESFFTNALVIPDHWDHPDAGKPFTESDDAEERYVAAVNAELREWGSGPPIQTTHNYVGYVVGQEDDELGVIPVRLSLMKSSSKTARSLNTLLRLAKDPTKRIFNISSESKNGPKGTYFIVAASQGRLAEPEEQAAAVALAQDYLHAQVQLTGDGDAEQKPEKPEPTGGLDVA